jgi:enterochelin esterase family protein
MRSLQWLRVLAFAVPLFASGGNAGEIAFGLHAPSPALGRDILYTLYRPTAPEGARLPVLYLFHGANGTERDWTEAGRAKETLDRLIDGGRIKPLIVIMPMAGNSWYVDNPDPGGAGPMSQALTRDLVAHVEGTYGTLACRDGRAVGGLSMGGYGALLYAMDNPDRYVAAVSLSGSVFRPMPTDRDPDAPPPRRAFRGAFGDPFDRARFNAANLFPRIGAYAARPDRPALFLAVGDDDFPRLKDGNVAFQSALAEAGVGVPLRHDPGEHVWPLWAAQLEPALLWLDAHLAARCDPAHDAAPASPR